MIPEHAWQAALGQLQMEIPKATFDTWVRDTRFLAYDDRVLTLGFHNSYARDWVESRLSSTLRRILMGILGYEVELRFEVIPLQRANHQQCDRCDEVEYGQDEEAQLPEPEANGEILVHLDTARQSLYEAMVQPERVTVIPGYFLRWIPYLGHQISWIVVALWQAFYRTFGKKAVAGKSFSVSGTELARWSGLSRRTMVSHLNSLASEPSGNLLSWFIERVETLNERRETAGRTSQYRFRLAMPLTPGDHICLTAALVRLGIGENPGLALRKALELQPKALLPYPAPLPKKDSNLNLCRPRTVQQTILELSGVTPQLTEYPEMVKLAEELASRLMPPKDVLVLSHYFLQHWLPLLGSGPGWLVALLRDEGYYDHKTGELRDRIRLDDGYTRLVAALGIARPNTIGEWLPTPITRIEKPPSTTPPQTRGRTRRARREETRTYVAQFLHKVGYIIDYTGKKETVWELQVKMAEPLIPAHQEIHDGLIEALRQTLTTSDETLLAWLLDGQEINVATESARKLGESYHAHSYYQEEVTTRFAQESQRELHRSEAGYNAFFTGSQRVLHRWEGELQREFHTLKHLINQHFKARSSLHEILTALQAEVEKATAQVAGDVHRVEEAGDLWDFDQLLRLDGTSDKRRREICKQIAIQPELGYRLIAWLLYGYEHRKTDERKTGIESPFGYALSRYRKVLPLAEYLDLAKQPPGELYELLTQSPYEWWGIPRRTQHTLNALVENGFLDLMHNLLEKNAQ
ncbi:MAG: hypothetical protein Fur0022_02600 [Anaerolineales bacterium]